jgi:hypothetical protein
MGSPAFLDGSAERGDACENILFLGESVRYVR